MARYKELTIDDIEAGSYTLSDLERLLGGSRITWRKFIKKFPEYFTLLESQHNLKVYKTTLKQDELLKLYKEMKSNNMTEAFTGYRRGGKI